ncbi:MAG: hypothetical protein ABFD60_13100 [Bryobacteraceae bacterium]
MTTKRTRRKGMLPPEWGLLNRVAEKLGVSKSLVSRVNSGERKNDRVEQALEAERAAMRQEKKAS